MHLVRSAAAGLAALACACEPGMLIGSDPSDQTVPDATVGDTGPADGGTPDNTGADSGSTTGGDGSPIFFATGFETGNLNDFGAGGADCYTGPVPTADGIINTVGPLPPVLGTASVPGYVHSGSYSAAFSINTSTGTAWARCFVNNGLPESAYYSAWFYILTNVTSSAGWSLLHWQSRLSDGGAQYLWDVSIVNEADGTLSPVVIDYARGQQRDGNQTIDAGAWFHLEAYLQRSDTDAGSFTMYLNDALLVNFAGVSTDTTPMFGFHIGNYAQSLTPLNLVVYVDDIVVSTEFVQGDGGLAQ